MMRRPMGGKKYNNIPAEPAGMLFCYLFISG
jgi:hypothetical protein